MFLHENNRNYNSYRFSYKFTFIFCFCLFLKTKNKNQVFSKLVVWLLETFLFFLFIACRTLLQSYAEFNRLLQRNLLTCYSCSYYSSMFEAIKYSQNTKSWGGGGVIIIIITIMHYGEMSKYPILKSQH